MNHLKRDTLRWTTLASLFGICLITGGLAVAERDSADTTMEPGTATMPSEDSKPFTANRDMIQLSEQHEALFSKLDVNKDGDIDRDEAQAYPPVAEQYDDLASKGTSLISRSELAAFEFNRP
jgi:hypothetical protein